MVPVRFRGGGLILELLAKGLTMGDYPNCNVCGERNIEDANDHADSTGHWPTASTASPSASILDAVGTMVDTLTDAAGDLVSHLNADEIYSITVALRSLGREEYAQHWEQALSRDEDLAEDWELYQNRKNGVAPTT
ncbi:hypothetical protein SEA_OCTOBIEN14_139 [Gordonia phage Octobien14]|uniref:Uncharacterized protein n=1 Tax=Gordonia phage Octobien14 TaxID=2483673 RepID=A0A3G3MBD9_9CAUD|nr:hypothetical protein L3Y22_gp105 [Gordonia phage Octobien14]AYR03274.1 hypothetical protein SEA_OCTOBIEN14_139 [Gordonia phage Octobien14]